MNKRLWIVPVALAVALGACDNMLEEKPTSFLSTSTYYKTVDDLEHGMLSGWGAFHDAFPGSYNGIDGFLGLISDQERTNPTEVNSPRNVGGLDWTAANTQGLDATWRNLYQLIYRENIVISRAPDIEGDQARKDEIVAEAKFLRGFAYMWLDRLYSDGPKPTDLSVPLLLTEEDQAVQEVARATSEEVQAAVIADLTAAEAVLPTASERGVEGRGRPTRGGARMALADLYLWRSSYMLSGEWQQVADWTQKVIDSGEYTLVKTGFFNIFNPSVKAQNTENIFFMVAAGQEDRQNTRYISAYGPRILGFNKGGGYGVKPATQWMLDSYIPGDVRGTIGPVPVTGTRESDTVAYRNYGCSTGAIAGFTDEGGHCGPLPNVYPYKFRATPLRAANGDVDEPLYRYAETFLMNAEAQNELGHPDKAVEEINKIRARARLGASGTEDRAQPADYTGPMTKTAVRQAVFMERNWELAHEAGKRWEDMVRRDSEEPGFWAEAIKHDQTPTETYHPIIDQVWTQTFKKRLPIPQREIDLNSALVQNHGY